MEGERLKWVTTENLHAAPISLSEMTSFFLGFLPPALSPPSPYFSSFFLPSEVLLMIIEAHYADQ